MLSLIALFQYVVEMLQYVEEDNYHGFSRTEATDILSYLKKFYFLIYLHLMFHILEVIHLLSRDLKKKDQDTVEVVSLVKGTKQLLQMFKETSLIHLF